MRATNHRYSDNRGKQKTNSYNSVKPNRKLKAFSFVIAASLALAALVVPTTTLAPDVDAFEDSRIASYSLGDINRFSSVITRNCVEIVTVPETEAVKETEAQPQTKKAEEKTEAEKTTSAQQETTKPETKSETKKADESKTEKSETSKAEEKNPEPKTEAKAESEEKSEASSEAEITANVALTALVDISNPDPTYSPSKVSLSAYDRAKLERLVMGEAGSTGFVGASLVAQTIRDTMNMCGSSSIDYIISEYKYYGSTAGEPNQTVKEAVSYIFDDNGSAVPHRILCFYTGTSEWHETQNFIVGYGTMRFFDFYN